MLNLLALNHLGWRPFFQQQLSLDELEDCSVARVMEHHRSSYELMSDEGSMVLPANPNYPAMTVGDWVLLDREHRLIRLLERQSLFSRKAAGPRVTAQLIAANVDTVFIVCSMNQDFSLNRIERYLALAHEADVEPVIVLTKADLCDESEQYVEQVRQLDSLLMVEAVNALDISSVEVLMSWCRPGQTVAFLGSSGVGKSTLFNSIFQENSQHTSAIREEDSKGRHTITARSLRCAAGGFLLMDTPGMRELQLADCEQGVEQTFADISDIASQCRFSDCQHDGEPGCAINAAITNGKLDPRRLSSYQKLMREQAINGASIAERRAADKQFVKMCKTIQSGKKARKHEM